MCPVCKVENFYWGGCFCLQFCLNSEPEQEDNIAKMVCPFIVHGAMSLINDQIKTVAEGVLRVCIPPA